jgi:hypothetical protein
MSNNNELPRVVENAIRELRDNAAFVSQIWSVLAGYRDIRTLEIEQPDLEDAKESIDKIFRCLDRYSEAVNEVSRHGFYSSPELDNYLGEIRKCWAESREYLENRDKKTKQNSLLWLVETLLEIFNTWVISDRELSGFLVKVLPAILPEEAIPSRSLIQAAKKEYSN